MGHRLLEKYPSLYQLCRFDLPGLKEQLNRLAAEDLSALSERALIDRMEAAYPTLADESIMTSKASNSGKVCHLREAMFISLPCGFSDADGNALRMYMVRRQTGQSVDANYLLIGFGVPIVLGDSPKYTAQTQLTADQVKKAKHVAPRLLASSLTEKIERLQLDISESRNRALLAVRELNELRTKLSQPLPEPEKLSLFARLKKRIKEILGQ